MKAKPIINLAAIEAQRLARLEQDRRAMAKRIAMLKQAQEDAIRRASCIKFQYQRAKAKRI